MPKGYVIFTEAIHDEAGMGEYFGLAMPTIIESGAEVLAVQDGADVLEGEWHGTRTIVLSFESVEAARAWYDSPAYQVAAKVRQAAATCNAVIVSGL